MSDGDRVTESDPDGDGTFMEIRIDLDRATDTGKITGSMQGSPVDVITMVAWIVGNAAHRVAGMSNGQVTADEVYTKILAVLASADVNDLETE